MKFRPLTFIKNLFDNKKFLVVFSLVCAVIFWLVIDISENPTREITVSDIPLVIADQTDDNGGTLKVVSEYNGNVSVTVSGPGYIVSTVDKEDVRVAVVSYADVNSPGTYVLNLTAELETSGCTVVKISPSYIKVDYDYDTAAQIPVEVDTSAFLKLLPQDREIFKGVLKNKSDGADITNLAVNGPSEVINSIVKVKVTPDIPTDTSPETQNFNGTLKFYDASDKEVDGSQLEYNQDTFVRVIVYKVADVALKPTFKNLPLCYSSTENGLPPLQIKRYNGNARVNHDMTHVKVRGPVEVIDRIIETGLELSPIDFMQVKPDNTSFNVSFVLADGVEVVDGTEEITVELKLGSLRTTTVEILPSLISFIGLPQGLEADSTITNEAIKVTVCYDRNKTTAAKAKSGIQLTVDCSDITTPSSVTRTINATAKAKDVYVWAVSITPAGTTIVVK